MIVLQGILENIRFTNPENGYMVVRFSPEGYQTEITAVGVLAGARAGELLRIEGDWENHPRFGEQFRVQSFEMLLPDTARGIRRYLSSGILSGIGPAMAEKLVAHFGSHTLEVLEASPERLREIPGIGPSKARTIAESWRSYHAIRTLMALMGRVGASPSAGARILHAYGAAALDMVREDPYRISREIAAISFEVADRMGQGVGIPAENEERLAAGLLHVMDRAGQSGHVFLPEKEALFRAGRLLAVDRELVCKILEKLHGEGAIVLETAGDENRIFLREFFDAETGVCAKLSAIQTLPPPVNPDEISLASSIEERLSIRLSEEQLFTLAKLLENRVAILTGGPGTGKTTLIRSLCSVMGKKGERISLAAPTGRAARRLSEVTGRSAMTLHRLLKYNQNEGRFEMNSEKPLESDVLIVDEASMVDISLMFHLVKALPVTSRLYLVGDISQLPSVGPGNVLGDLIHSGKIPSFTLKTIFRQAAESPIILNAHRVNEGRMPEFPSLAEGDLSEFYFIRQSNPENAVKIIVELCTKRIPERFGFDSVRDIQVLTPMHRGEVGTLHLNQVLQKALNPLRPGQAGKGGFRVGDKVIHLKNNYQKDVFNGDIGRVCRVDEQEGVLAVDYSESSERDREVFYTLEELDELSLAYAISVHKAQGSEYPVVIIPLMMQHAPLLQRNLVYTAMTRGKKLVIFVGLSEALGMAIRNDRPTRRFSALVDRLKSMSA